MNKLLLLLSLCIAVAIAIADKPKALQFPPRDGTHLILCDRAIDGDTIVFYWLIEDRGRLWGINAPELHGDDTAAGAAARLYLGSKLPLKPVKAHVGREKYGRALVDIILDDGQSLSKMMVEAGHAKTWDGKGARP